MHLRQCLADTGAMRCVRLARPDAFEKIDDRHRPACKRAEGLTALVDDGLRTIDPVRREVAHQPEEERKIVLGDALLIQGQNVTARGRVEQIVGILHAFGDALVGEHFADVVRGEEIRKLFGGDVGVNRHRKITPRRRCAADAAAGRTRFPGRQIRFRRSVYSERQTHP